MTKTYQFAFTILLVLGLAQHADAFSAQGRKNEPSQHVESTRRTFFNTGASAGAAVASAAALIPADAAIAAASVDLDTYEDKKNGFSISVPKSWTATEQKLPDRRKIQLFIDQSGGAEEDKCLMFLAYTPVRDDFTSLGSFGSVEEVGQSTILPKGEIMGEETTSKLVSAESKKNA